MIKFLGQVYEFKTPLVLLLVLIIFWLLWMRRRHEDESIRFSSVSLFDQNLQSWKIKLIQLPWVLRILVLALFIVALAGPRAVLEKTQVNSEGIDIVLTIDTSGSMMAEDFKLNGQRQNRLEVVKNVVSDFTLSRTNDRLGIIAFAAESYTVCPLTTDYNWLRSNLERIQLGLITDGTAIGSAILSSVNRLKNSTAKSKVVILLTDGVNNAGQIDPIKAAEIAQNFGIKIYTIGAGTKGYAPIPAADFFGQRVYQNMLVEIDEETLTKVAQITHGKYFRATDTESLRNIYKEIDALEKSKIEQVGYKEYKELFPVVLTLALIFLAIEIFLSQMVLMRIP